MLSRWRRSKDASSSKSGTSSQVAKSPPSKPHCTQCGQVHSKKEIYCRECGTQISSTPGLKHQKPTKPSKRTPRGLMLKAGLKSLAKSLAISALIFGPAFFLFEEEPIIVSVWLLVGSFAMMAWTYRRPWRLMWITILLPPLAAASAYAIQLAFLSGKPDIGIVLASLAAGMAVGFWRGRAHRVYIRDNAIFAQRTLSYLGLWLVCYAVSQGFAFANMKAALNIGRAGGAFSTAMLAMVCVVLLIRFLREHRQLTNQARPNTAMLGLLFVALLLPAIWTATPGNAQIIANSCKLTAYPDADSPGSGAIFIQQTVFNKPITGDLRYYLYIIQNPNSNRGRAIISGLWPNEMPHVLTRDSYVNLLAMGKEFCRTKAVDCNIKITGGPQPTQQDPATPPPVVPPAVTPPHSSSGGIRPWTPTPPQRSSANTKETAAATALVSTILVIAGIGANVATTMATAMGGAVQAAAQAAGEPQPQRQTPRSPTKNPIAPTRPEPANPRSSRKRGARTDEPESRGGPQNGSPAHDDPRPKSRKRLTGTIGEKISDPDTDLPSSATEQAGGIYDTLSNPNNWWPFGRAMTDMQKRASEISGMVGRAGWDNTGLGWGINLVTGTLGRAAGEIADLPSQAVAAAGAIAKAASDKENWTVAWETGRDSVVDLGGLIVGHQGTQKKVTGTIVSGVETAGSIAGTLSVAVEQDPAGAALGATKAILGADNWAKVIDGDVPLLERMGRSLWGAVDTGGTIWGVGTTAVGAAGKVSSLVRGADLSGNLATGARTMGRMSDAAATGRGLNAAGGVADGTRMGRTAENIGDAGALGRARNAERTVEAGTDLGRTADRTAEVNRAEAAGTKAARSNAAAGPDDGADFLAKQGDEVGDGPNFPKQKEPVDPELARQRQREVQGTLKKEGVRDDLVDRMDYEHHGSKEKDFGSVYGTRQQKARGAVHREGFEKTTKDGVVPRSDTSKKSTALHEVEHIQQHDQMRTQAARGGPKESYYDPQTGKLTQNGNIQMEMEVRVHELDRNLVIRENAIKRAGADPGNPKSWPPEARAAQEEIDMARDYLDYHTKRRVPETPPPSSRASWRPDDVTDPDLNLSDLRGSDRSRANIVPEETPELDLPDDLEIDEIYHDLGMTPKPRK